jgi:hypothetical protein
MSDFLFLIGQLSFPGVVGPIDLAILCLSLGEVILRAGPVVLVQLDDNSVLIVYDPQRILSKQLTH